MEDREYYNSESELCQECLFAVCDFSCTRAASLRAAEVRNIPPEECKLFWQMQQAFKFFGKVADGPI
jgi:hypothetical protein